jgi:hypothetical protein
VTEPDGVRDFSFESDVDGVPESLGVNDSCWVGVEELLPVMSCVKDDEDDVEGVTDRVGESLVLVRDAV